MFIRQKKAELFNFGPIERGAYTEHCATQLQFLRFHKLGRNIDTNTFRRQKLNHICAFHTFLCNTFVVFAQILYFCASLAKSA